MSSNISNTKKEKINLIENISDFCNVPDKFKNTMKKSLLKLSHSDLSNVALGLVVYPKYDTKKYDKDGNIISISFGWEAEDVEWVQQTDFPEDDPLTKEEISSVLYRLDKTYDCSSGATWTHVNHFVNEAIKLRSVIDDKLKESKCQ